MPASRYGKDKGYYKEQGIDLDIRSGNGSGSAHRLVANGDSTFSYGSCASMTNLAAQGAPLISVGVIDAMGTEAIIVRPDAGVKDDQGPEGQGAAHHRQCRREHLLPAGAEECRPDGRRREDHQRAGRRAGLVLSAEGGRRGRHPRRPRRQAGGDQGQWRRRAGRLPLFRLRREPGRLLHRRAPRTRSRRTRTW